MRDQTGGGLRLEGLGGATTCCIMAWDTATAPRYGRLGGVVAAVTALGPGGDYSDVPTLVQANGDLGPPSVKAKLMMPAGIESLYVTKVDAKTGRMVLDWLAVIQRFFDCYVVPVNDADGARLPASFKKVGGEWRAAMWRLLGYGQEPRPETVFRAARAAVFVFVVRRYIANVSDTLAAAIGTHAPAELFEQSNWPALVVFTMVLVDKAATAAASATAAGAGLPGAAGAAGASPSAGDSAATAVAGLPGAAGAAGAAALRPSAGDSAGRPRMLDASGIPGAAADAFYPTAGVVGDAIQGFGRRVVALLNEAAKARDPQPPLTPDQLKQFAGDLVDEARGVQPRQHEQQQQQQQRQATRAAASEQARQAERRTRDDGGHVGGSGGQGEAAGGEADPAAGAAEQMGGGGGGGGGGAGGPVGGGGGGPVGGGGGGPPAVADAASTSGGAGRGGGGRQGRGGGGPVGGGGGGGGGGGRRRRGGAAAAELEVTRLRDQCAAHEQQVRQLQQQLATRDQELATRDQQLSASQAQCAALIAALSSALAAQRRP